MHANELAEAIIAVCPVTNVRVGKAHDRTTWTFTPTPEATQTEIDAGVNVIDTIEDTPDVVRGVKQQKVV